MKIILITSRDKHEEKFNPLKYAFVKLFFSKFQTLLFKKKTTL